MNKVVNIATIPSRLHPLGTIHNRAIHNFASPPPIQPIVQANQSAMHINNSSTVPGKWAINPATINGNVTQLGIRLVRKSYKLTRIDNIKRSHVSIIVMLSAAKSRCPRAVAGSLATDSMQR